MPSEWDTALAHRLCTPAFVLARRLMFVNVTLKFHWFVCEPSSLRHMPQHALAARAATGTTHSDSHTKKLAFESPAASVSKNWLAESVLLVVWPDA